MAFSYNEFHISKKIRDYCKFDSQLYSSSGNVILANLSAVRAFQAKFNEYLKSTNQNQISAGTLNAMGLLDEVFHLACYTYRRRKFPSAFADLLAELNRKFGTDQIENLLVEFCKEFPPTCVYKGECSITDFLDTELTERKTGRVRTNREQTLEEMIMLRLCNENPAFRQFIPLFDDSLLAQNSIYSQIWNTVDAYFKSLPFFGTYGHDLITFLKEPVSFAPDNLQEQLNYVRLHWAELFLPGDGEGEDFWIKRLFGGSDLLAEEWKPEWKPGNGGSPDMSPPNYDYLLREYERFSDDKEWMPRVVLMAKTVLVWLYQLSKKYGREISRLDQIPDEELDLLRDQGFTGLWLIGLWERSQASKKIKQICGNPEAAASAYSLEDYEIAQNLGGWDALNNLRTRLWQRGIRLASDMVPNHTGMDSKWVVEKPELFMQRRDNPFPHYTFNGPNLSHDSRVAIYLEDHYYSKNDCSVVFKRVDTATGDTRYIYHGNDGTGLPWNDTAQIDFLNQKAREEVIQEILKIARNFPIIRFDAAMVLAKKHIKRLWYPEPGKGGDIATRSEFALSAQEFEKRIPNEFWREVVDRVAQEVPDTLLLAEAFWMMEGYFTRTLGMHRVYNSAFMNMLKKEDNAGYRSTIKNTIVFDPQILKRYVNFMNNPDEETAVAQFGKGDKYFGVCTLMSTMPGLPMFGHGQIEGFEEKYGMEYMKAYRDEKPDGYLIERHNREIFPLLNKRYLFAGVENFLFYDVWNNGSVNENIFAYSNKCAGESSIVFYNNKYERACGWIKQSCPYAVKLSSNENDKKLVTRTIAQGLELTAEDGMFVTFREQRSNLTFIRRSKEIAENGMFTSLNGFETQVFIDIHEHKDKDGSLEELCTYLNGSGTKDLAVTWQEIHYKALYEKFEALLSKTQETYEQNNEKKLTAAKLKALLEQELTDFYETANEFAEKEALFEYEQKQKELKEAKKAKTKVLKNEAKTARTKQAKAFAFKAIKEPKIAPVKLTAVKTAEKLTAQEKAELCVNRQKELLKEQILYFVLPLAKEGFAHKWALERKIEEVLAGTYAYFEKAFILATAQADAQKIASLLVNSKYEWLLSGANVFDGTKWFNKEKMEDSLKIAQKVLSFGKKGEQIKELETLFNNLDKAQKQAEYKCDIFIENVCKLEPR